MKISHSLLIKNFKIEKNAEKEYLTFFFICYKRLFSEQVLWKLHCCLATITLLRVTLVNAFTIYGKKKILAMAISIMKFEFSGFHIFYEKFATYEAV